MQRPNPASKKSIQLQESPQNVFLKQLQQNLEDVEQELQLSYSKNLQLTKLVEILTEQRNYYQQQLRSSETIRLQLENQVRKQKVEADSKSILISELKKANRALEQQISALSDNLQETQFLFQAQDQQIDRIRKEKQLIEAQWNRVIREINTKMHTIQKNQQEEDKQNMEILGNLPLKDKVKKALRKIDRQIKLTAKIQNNEPELNVKSENSMESTKNEFYQLQF